MAKTSAQKSAEYRAKDIEAYREKKRLYAKTPEQREKRTQYMRTYRAENREKMNEQARVSHEKSRRQRTPEQRHNEHLKATYGITHEIYLAMLARQGGKCLICGSDTARWKKRFHVDHCHQTGKIRGLLCNRCNPMLGWFERYKDAVQTYLHDEV
jgi:Recombination endonuclease VII